MLHDTDFAKLVTELYTLLGHQVERVVTRGDSKFDLFIKSQDGEEWIARCQEQGEVSVSDLRDLFQVLQVEKAKQAAIITTGIFSFEAQQLAKGKPIHLLDGHQFQTYLSRARELAQKSHQVQPVSITPERAEPTKKCPYCAETIKAEAIVCRFCGRNLVASPPAQSLPQPQIIEVQPVNPLPAQRASPKPKRSGCVGCAGWVTGIAVLGMLAIAAWAFIVAIPGFFMSPPPAPPTITPGGPTFTPPPPTRTPLPPTATLSPEARKARWGTVDIRELVKNPDRYIGSELHYKGEVFNIQEDGSGAAMQVWVQIPGGSEFDREAVMVYWQGRTTNIYEGTTIEFWGYGMGSVEGTNAFGAAVVQPLISAEYITYFR